MADEKKPITGDFAVTPNGAIRVTWKSVMAAVAVVAAISAGTGGGIAAGTPSVSMADIERLEARRETRIQQERERSDAVFAGDRDVARLAEQISALDRRVAELTSEISALRAERRDR